MPLGLSFGMSREGVKTHLTAFTAYIVNSHDANMLIYVIPSPDNGTKNGLFLKFSKDKLVDIASTKADMSLIYTKNILPDF